MGLVWWGAFWREQRGRLLVKAAVIAALLTPAVLYGFWLGTGALGGRPVMEAIHGTGLWAIRLLLLSLAITPLARVLDWNALLLIRRNVGVAAACYAVAHLLLYVAEQNYDLVKVVSEIALRFYLTIGFVALLILLALAGTSFDAAVKRLGRNWKRLHRLAYPVGAVALLHFYIQAKANVSEPVLFSGLFVWLMLWRVLPVRWQRNRNLGGRLAVLSGLAVASALATAVLEVTWYGLTTRINPWRIWGANYAVAHGLRPAHWVFVVAVLTMLVVLLRRLAVRLRVTRRAIA